MKSRKFIIIVFVLLFIWVTNKEIMAQCAMCSETARTATEGKNENAIALNNGILYLMTIPYIMLLSIAFLWWKYSRKKKNQDSASS